MTTYIKLDPKFKKKWLKALRGKSGFEYVQTTQELAQSPGWKKFNPATRKFEEVPFWGFCCLGVGCDVMVREGLNVEESPLEFDGERWFYLTRDFEGEEPCWSYLDKTEWDASVCNVVNMDMSAMKILIKMNDDGASFATIADWIEENL